MCNGSNSVGVRSGAGQARGGGGDRSAAEPPPPIPRRRRRGAGATQTQACPLSAWQGQGPATHPAGGRTNQKRDSQREEKGGGKNRQLQRSPLATHLIHAQKRAGAVWACPEKDTRSDISRGDNLCHNNAAGLVHTSAYEARRRGWRREGTAPRQGKRVVGGDRRRSPAPQTEPSGGR